MSKLHSEIEALRKRVLYLDAEFSTVPGMDLAIEEIEALIDRVEAEVKADSKEVRNEDDNGDDDFPYDYKEDHCECGHDWKQHSNGLCGLCYCGHPA